MAEHPLEIGHAGFAAVPADDIGMARHNRSRPGGRRRPAAAARPPRAGSSETAAACRPSPVVPSGKTVSGCGSSSASAIRRDLLVRRSPRRRDRCRACGSGRRASRAAACLRTSALETKAVPVEPPRIKMSSQLMWLAMTKLCGSSGAPSSRDARTDDLAPQQPRKRRGQGERRPPQLGDEVRAAGRRRNSRIKPGDASQRREAAKRRRSALAVNGDAVKFHAMVDQAEAEPLGDPLLRAFPALRRRTR